MAPEPERRTRTLAERGLVRLTADIPVEDARLLEQTATKSGFNKVTTVVRALRLLAEVEAHQRAGGEVLLRNADGTQLDRLRLL